MKAPRPVLLALLFLTFAIASNTSAQNRPRVTPGLTPSESLEYKGMTKAPGKPRVFSILNKETQYQKWLRVGQRTGDFTLKEYLPVEDHLVFEKDGESGVIELSKPEVGMLPNYRPDGGKEIASKDLIFKEGLYYERGTDTPFTGRVGKKYPNGKLWYKRALKDGMKHGQTGEWFPNGQKKYEMFYRDNQRTGVWTYWDQRGKITAKREYENNQFKRNLPLK